MQSHYDEADYVFHNSIVGEGKHNIKVISADIDVCVLLCSMYVESDWSSAEVYIENLHHDTKFISIKKTTDTHKATIPSLIVLLTLYGIDTDPIMFGIGKVKH